MNVLVTKPFTEAQLERIRAVAPDVRVTREDAKRADFSQVDVLYTWIPPRDLARAPRLKWVQVHMAGTDALHEHPIYTQSTIPLTTTSGVHAATIAEYAITALLALAHRVPRMVEWKARGGWPPDAERWPLFVPTEVRGATLGIIGYGSIGRELARITKTAFAMTVLACKRDPSRHRDSGYQVPGTGDPEGALPDEWLGPGQLHSLLARSEDHGAGPRDISAMIAMLDYLIVEISRVDAMSAQCLLQARTLLVERFAPSRARTH